MHKAMTGTLLLTLALGLGGCSSDTLDSGSNTGGTGGSTNTGGNGGNVVKNSCVDDGGGIKKCTLDASSYTAYQYFNFTTGEFVNITDDAAPSDASWDIAFRRFAVKSNGGTSGSGKRGAALIAAQDDFYNADGTPNQSKFTNATAAGERDHLTAQMTVPSSWVSDKILSAVAPDVVILESCPTPPGKMDYGWYTYHGGCLPTPHSTSANSNRGWVLKSAEGTSYARFRATTVTVSQTNGLSATFEMKVQPPNTSNFTTDRSFSVSNLNNATKCYDFDAGAEVADCTGTAWDIQVGYTNRNAFLRTNSGVSGKGQGGALGPLDWSAIENYANGTTAVQGAPYLQDSTGSLLDQKAWYAYGIEGNNDHKIWPNYRVYMLNSKTDDNASKLYAVQVINYYDSTGKSGIIQFLYREVAR